MSFDALKTNELKKVAESFGVDAPEKATKQSLILALQEEGITYDMYAKFNDAEQVEIKADPKPAKKTKSNKENSVLVRMDRANPSYDTNGYTFTQEGQQVGATNPTLVLLRGGSYIFQVNQDSGFWIQGVPGITGYDPLQPNVQTRDILGVTYPYPYPNAGVYQGEVVFDVPQKDAQDEYNLPGNNQVGVVSTLTFDQVNGKRVGDLGGIEIEVRQRVAGEADTRQAREEFLAELDRNRLGAVEDQAHAREIEVAGRALAEHLEIVPVAEVRRAEDRRALLRGDREPQEQIGRAHV